MTVQVYLGTFIWVGLIFWVLFKGTANVFGRNQKLTLKYRLVLGIGFPLAVMVVFIAIGIIGEIMLAPLKYLYQIIKLF